jgi:YD repeat-containing protein
MLFRLALAASTLLVAACTEAETGSTLTAEPVALFPDDPGRERVGALRYTGGLVLSSDDDRFGGWSAIEVSEDGARLLALSDNASWMTARFAYDGDGRLSGLTDIDITPMLDSDGRLLEGDAADAEGLAPLGGGSYAVSFERQHRIERYEIGADWSAIATAAAEPLPAPPGAERLRNNAGIEALAVSGEALWAGVEYPLVEGQPYTLWRFDPADETAAPRALALALTAGFGLTALAPDGEGGLFVVERFYARNVGNRIRIGRLSVETLNEGSGPIMPELVAEISPEMTVDNIEAIALAEVDGEPRLFLMSDDNFNARQRTILLSFALEDEGATGSDAGG